MKTNLVLDSLQYMAHAGKWTTALFDILLLAGVVIAALVWRRRPEQRMWSRNVSVVTKHSFDASAAERLRLLGIEVVSDEETSAYSQG